MRFNRERQHQPKGTMTMLHAGTTIDAAAAVAAIGELHRLRTPGTVLIIMPGTKTRGQNDAAFARARLVFFMSGPDEYLVLKDNYSLTYRAPVPA